MGEAKRKGTYEERKSLSKDKKIKSLTKEMIDFSDPNMFFLEKGYTFLKGKVHSNEWERRRNTIIEYLKNRPIDYSSKNSKIRFKEDEIAWYIFLCEEFFRNPLCTNPSQMSRIAPWIISLGRSVDILEELDNIKSKLIDLTKKYKNNPDGTLFELLVAASYLRSGFKVEFLEENGAKTPDLKIYNHNTEFYVECKKLQRRTDYAEWERDTFLKSWDQVKSKLLGDYPNYWFEIEIKQELSDKNLLDLNLKFNKLKDVNSKTKFYEDEEIVIIGIKRSIFDINKYLDNNYVKMESYTFSKLLGGNSVQSNSDRTHILEILPEYFEAASAPVLGAFVKKINRFSGATRKFSNENSQAKKAKAVGKQVKEALNQLENFQNKVVHVLYEAMESEDIEHLRWQKIEECVGEISTKLTSRDSIKIHRIQYIESVDQMFDILETIKVWGRSLPYENFVIVPNE